MKSTKNADLIKHALQYKKMGMSSSEAIKQAEIHLLLNGVSFSAEEWSEATEEWSEATEYLSEQ